LKKIALLVGMMGLWLMATFPALAQTQSYYVLAKGNWVEYVMVKAVNATIPCDTSIDSKGFKPLRNGDKIRIEIVDVVYDVNWVCIYPNDTVAIKWQNGLIIDVSLNGEMVWENLSIPSFSQVFPSSLDLHGWVFHPIGGNGYWNSFGNWSEYAYTTMIGMMGIPPINFSLAINNGVVVLCYENGNLGDFYFSQVSRDTGVYLEMYFRGVGRYYFNVSNSKAEYDLRIIDSNIPNILDLPLSPIPSIPIVVPPTAVSLNTPAQNEIGTSSIVLGWSASPDNDFLKYEIYMSTFATQLGSLLSTINTKATTTYAVTNLSPSTTYYFTVRVYNTGNLYTDSNKLTVTTSSEPPFYMQPWFIALTIIIVAAVIAVVVIMMRKKVIT